MDIVLQKMLDGYQVFRKKYVLGDVSIMHTLAKQGQQPEIMVVACCDSRVDPALILQCDPGDLFVARNVANIVPPYEKDEAHHGTSAALEFGIRGLGVKHLIILGHSRCGGIEALIEQEKLPTNDFISNWVSLIKTSEMNAEINPNQLAQQALLDSYQNCLTFPWIKEKVATQRLNIHLWFFDIQDGEIFSYSQTQAQFVPLLTI